MISTCGSVWKAAKRPFRKPWCRGQKEVVMYCLLLVTGLSLLLTHAFSQMPMVTIKSNGWFEMKANLILIASDGHQEQAAMTGSCCCDRWPDTSAAHLPQWKRPQAQFCWVALPATRLPDRGSSYCSLPGPSSILYHAPWESCLSSEMFWLVFGVKTVLENSDLNE